MLIWLILFLLIVIASFILAIRSMADFRESPLYLKVPYSTFLIQKPDGLTEGFITKLYSQIKKERLIVSMEKLYKGQRRALVIYGPMNILGSFKEELGLLELEDYSLKVSGDKISQGKVAAWEVGSRVSLLTVSFSSYKIPQLEENEQVFWQLVLSPKEDGLPLETKPVAEAVDVYQGVIFQATLRLVVIADNPNRLKELQKELSRVGNKEGLAVLPQAYSLSQIVNFYQQRSAKPFAIGQKKDKKIVLNPKQVTGMVRLLD